LQLAGFDLAKTDQPNHRIPNLQYNLYFRPEQSLPKNLIPVIFEVQSGKQIGCSMSASLYWLPTTKWKQGHLYRVAMQPLETQSNDPGTAQLLLSVEPSLSQTSCQEAWAHRKNLAFLGTQTISW
jgi:hypothetical protein